MGKGKYYHKNIPFYEVYKDGLYVGVHNGCMVAKKRLTSYLEDIDVHLLDEGQEGFELAVPKIDYKYWYMIWSFYRDVERDYGTEAAVLIYWDDKGIGKEGIPENLLDEYGEGLYIEGKLLIYVPRQENTKTSTVYNGDALRNWLSNNMSVYMDTHSHNSMEAFFSGTDDANETRYQLYAVYGRVGYENTFIVRYRFQGTWYSVEISEVIDNFKEKQGSTGESTYPKGWLNNCVFH